MGAPKPNKRILLKVLLISAVCLLSLEAAVRVYVHVRRGAPYNEYNPDLGWSMIPGKTIRHNFSDVALNMRFNSLGFNDVEWKKQKAPGTVRIAFLGDSLPAGIQVDKAGTFPALTAQFLNQDFKGAPPIETMNFGVPGYSFDQEYLLYERVIKEFKPDIIVLCVLTANDFFDGMNPYNKGAASFKPYYEIGRHGELILKNVPAPRNLDTFPTGSGPGVLGKISGFLRMHVATYSFIAGKLRSSFPGYFHDPSVTVKFMSGGVPEDVFLDKPTAEWDKAIRLYFRLAEELEKQSAGRNTKLVAVTMPLEYQVSDDLWNRTREKAQKQGKKYSRYGIENRIVSEFQALGVPAKSLVQPLGQYAKDQGLKTGDMYFAENIHLTGKGHQAVARLIADFLEPVVRETR